MITTFFMPTRIVSGTGALGTIGSLARDLKMSRVLLVSDPVISAQPFHAAALAALSEAASTPAAPTSTTRVAACGARASTA